jgi:hypothetical protein
MSAVDSGGPMSSSFDKPPPGLAEAHSVYPQVPDEEEEQYTASVSEAAPSSDMHVFDFKEPDPHTPASSFSPVPPPSHDPDLPPHPSPGVFLADDPSDNEPPPPAPPPPPPDLLPPQLQAIVFHARDSLTYAALEMRPLPALPQSLLTSVVNELRHYGDNAVAQGLIDEACYVQQCIDYVRSDRAGAKIAADRELKSVEERLMEATLELEEREKYWGTQMAMVQRELEMALEDLEIGRQQAISDLDNEWESAKKRQLYSKPSPELLNLRHRAQKMIRTKQFEEVKKVSVLIEAKQKAEIEDATRRMNADYARADQQLRDRFDVERSVVIETNQMKIHSLIRAHAQNMRPINQRIQNLEKIRDEVTKTSKAYEQQQMAVAAIAKRSESRSGRSTARGSAPPPPNAPQLPSLIGMPKLALPSVTRINRQGTKSQGAQQRMQTRRMVSRPSTGLSLN